MQPPEGFTRGDIAVGIVGLTCTFALAYMAIWQHGYDTARAECKPPAKMVIPFHKLTHKQQLRATRWAARDQGWIK